MRNAEFGMMNEECGNLEILKSEILKFEILKS